MRPPVGWQATVSPAGGTDLRVSSPNKQSFLIILWIVAIVWSVLVFLPLFFSGLGLVLAVALLALAAWCTFGDESWHLDVNLLEHRIGIGQLCHRRKYIDAELQIVERFSIKTLNLPYYRLYAVCRGARKFLIERNEPELEALQVFIADCTGWRAIEPSYE
jgi:hypothetical protein